MATVKGLLDRLKDGEDVLVAEGYLFEFEARGYLKIGAYVPEVVLEHPNLLRDMHHEFVHAGSDVVLAFTYYAHREKLRLIGREADVEKMNKTALKIAREVADETGTLMAGNICNSTRFTPGDEGCYKEVYAMFKEQIEWAVDAGADFIVGETFNFFGEAELALKAIKEFGNGLPAVVTLAFHADGLYDNVPAGEACRKLEQAGAAVVGINCSRGPSTMLPVLKEIRQACQGPIAALPVCYRTDIDHRSFQSLDDIDNPNRTAFPIDLPAWLCSQTQIADFTREAKALGVQYIGLCCGNRAHYTRTMAEALGRKPPASRYAPDMAKHYSRVKGDHYAASQNSFTKSYKTTK